MSFFRNQILFSKKKFSNLYSMNFDGVNEYINAGTSTNLNTASTSWCLWYRSTSDTIQCTMGKTNTLDGTQHFGLWLGNATGALTNELISIVRNSTDARIGYTTTDRTELFDGEWHSIILTANGTAYNLYLDGVDLTLTVGQGANNGLTTITGYNLFTIAAFNAASSHINGDMDEIAVFNTGLTQTQATEYHNNGEAMNLKNHSAFNNLVLWVRGGDGASFGTQWVFPNASGFNSNTYSSVNMEQADRTTSVP